jgi:uncharacterized protein (UPF0332 family)
MNHTPHQNTVAFWLISIDALSGAFDKDLARWANKAFGLRQRGDYREYFDLSLSEVAPYIQRAEEFLRAAREHLRGKKGIE